MKRQPLNLQIATADLNPESIDEHVASMTEEWKMMAKIMEKTQISDNTEGRMT